MRQIGPNDTRPRGESKKRRISKFGISQEAREGNHFGPSACASNIPPTLPCTCQGSDGILERGNTIIINVQNGCNTRDGPRFKENRETVLATIQILTAYAMHGCCLWQPYQSSSSSNKLACKPESPLQMISSSPIHVIPCLHMTTRVDIEHHFQ